MGGGPPGPRGRCLDSAGASSRSLCRAGASSRPLCRAGASRRELAAAGSSTRPAGGRCEALPPATRARGRCGGWWKAAAEQNSCGGARPAQKRKDYLVMVVLFHKNFNRDIITTTNRFLFLFLPAARRPRTFGPRQPSTHHQQNDDSAVRRACAASRVAARVWMIRGLLGDVRPGAVGAARRRANNRRQ